MGILDRILKKKQEYELFKDPLGNFEISYPKGWKHDKDIAVVEGKYTISFESGDRSITVYVDAALKPDFRFSEYEKKELESPTAGIIADVKKSKFRGMPAYKREYAYESGGKAYFGGGLMFHTGMTVFSLSWSAPEKKREEFKKILDHVLDTLVIRLGFTGKGIGA